MKRPIRLAACGWAALLALLAVQLLLARHPPGPAHLFIALGIAGIMATIVIFCSMELARAPRLAAIFAYAGLFWVLILFGLGGAEYVTRVFFTPPQATETLPPAGMGMP